MDIIYYKQIFLKKKINKKDVKRVLGLRFRRNPELIDEWHSNVNGFLLCYDDCNLPYEIEESGIFLLMPNSENKKSINGWGWKKYLIAENLEIFASLLNLYVEVFTEYDLEGYKNNEFKKTELIDRTLKKVVKISPENDLQHWCDLLENHFEIDGERMKEVQKLILVNSGAENSPILKSL